MDFHDPNKNRWHFPEVLRVVEVGGDVQQVIHAFVEVIQVRGHILQPLLGQLQTA